MSEPQKETYSFSKLSSFDTCPRMWQLTYLDNAPKLKGVFSEYGTLVHSILERYEKGELTLDSLPAVFDWEWDFTFDGMKWPPNKYVDLAESYKKQGMQFFENFHGFGDDFEILGVEQHFVIPISDFLLQGFIDLAYRRDGKLGIRDWKTAKTYTKPDLAYKRRQPYLYASWVKEEFGRLPDEISFHHTRDDNLVCIPFSEEDYHEAIDWATEQVERIRAAWVFDPQPSEFFCMNICSVRGSCEYGKLATWRRKR